MAAWLTNGRCGRRRRGLALEIGVPKAEAWLRLAPGAKRRENARRRTARRRNLVSTLKSTYCMENTHCGDCMHDHRDPPLVFKQPFGQYQDEALTQPVAITRNGRERLVMLSADEYRRLKRRDREGSRCRGLRAMPISLLIAKAEMHPRHAPSRRRTRIGTMCRYRFQSPVSSSAIRICGTRNTGGRRKRVSRIGPARLS